MLESKISDFPIMLAMATFSFVPRHQFIPPLLVKGHMFHSHPSNFLKIRCWSVIQKECADKRPILGADSAGNTELV